MDVMTDDAEKTSWTMSVDLFFYTVNTIEQTPLIKMLGLPWFELPQWCHDNTTIGASVRGLGLHTEQLPVSNEHICF